MDTNFIYQDGYDEGMATGRAEGLAVGKAEGLAVGKAEERALHIRAYADTVLRIAETNGSVEEALSIVRIPDDCIDEVRTKVLGRSGP